MVENVDLLYRCVLEVVSKNDFKIFRNCYFLSKCLLKINKMVKIEEKNI